jgi:hypothetical protein
LKLSEKKVVISVENMELSYVVALEEIRSSFGEKLNIYDSFNKVKGIIERINHVDKNIHRLDIKELEFRLNNVVYNVRTTSNEKFRSVISLIDTILAVHKNPSIDFLRKKFKKLLADEPLATADVKYVFDDFFASDNRQQSSIEPLIGILYASLDQKLYLDTLQLQILKDIATMQSPTFVATDEVFHPIFCELVENLKSNRLQSSITTGIERCYNTIQELQEFIADHLTAWTVIDDLLTQLKWKTSPISRPELLADYLEFRIVFT